MIFGAKQGNEMIERECEWLNCVMQAQNELGQTLDKLLNLNHSFSGCSRGRHADCQQSSRSDEDFPGTLLSDSALTLINEIVFGAIVLSSMLFAAVNSVDC